MNPQSPPAPIVSVIVPAYNAGRYITQTLESIAAQQGDFRTEIIVVDDGSTDDTREKVHAFDKARVITQQNAGPSAARNRGVAAAQGAYVAFLDSDDLWTEKKLAVQMPIFDEHPEIAMVFGDCQRFDVNGPIAEPFFREAGLGEDFWGGPVIVKDPYLKLFRTNYIPTGSAVVRKSCLEAAGGFDEQMRYVEDLDMWLRLAYLFPVAYTPHLCQLKRQHGANVSNNAEAMTLGHIQVLTRQREMHGDLLRANGIRLASQFCMEYCLLGYRYEREGNVPEARRWYWKGMCTQPSLRPLYYLARTLLGGNVRKRDK
jgi:glycosyltransferase involved in cell wall biosynthesis